MLPPKDLKFSMNQIVVEGVSLLDFDVFQEIEENSIEKNKIGDEILAVDVIEKKYRHEKFVSLYFQKGEKYPYSETVFDTESSNKIPNPRNSSSIETDNQLFALIDVNTSRIYLSNQKQRTYIESWLTGKLKKNVSIKPLMDEGDFLQQVESISHISLTAEPRQIQAGDSATLEEALNNDIYGFGAEKAVLTLIYKQRSVRGRLKEVLGNIIESKSRYKNVTIVGKNVLGFESVFNTEVMTTKIPMSSSRDEKTGKFKEEDVFESLINKIRHIDQA